MTTYTHSHLCPSCFEYVPCDMDCTLDGDVDDENGLPTAHPVLCDECEEFEPHRLRQLGFDPIELGM